MHRGGSLDTQQTDSSSTLCKQWKNSLATESQYGVSYLSELNVSSWQFWTQIFLHLKVCVLLQAEDWPHL